MTDILFVHGMFQNAKSWEKWTGYFSERGFNCVSPSWPLHEGDPRALRESPPEGLGDLHLETVIDAVESEVRRLDRPVMIGHSVGGLITQIMANKGLVSSGVAINSVAPNAMIDLDWGFIKNSAIIANPLKGNDPVLMDAKTFHGAFANTLSEEEAEREFEKSATHDSRNVLRDCMGKAGRIDLDAPHAPLLLIGGEEDQIIPAHLTEKNFDAYSDKGSVTDFLPFAGRSHYICNEPGWEQVAEAALQFIQRNETSPRPLSNAVSIA
ncbi:alpha/beta hydrolase [Sphingopyxis fribergensis]